MDSRKLGKILIEKIVDNEKRDIIIDLENNTTNIDIAPSVEITNGIKHYFFDEIDITIGLLEDNTIYSINIFKNLNINYLSKLKLIDNCGDNVTGEILKAFFYGVDSNKIIWDELYDNVNITLDINDNISIRLKDFSR